MKRLKSVSDANGDGHIFTRSDFHFYRGLYHLYLKDYDKTLEDFHKCYQLKESSNSFERLNTVDIDNE